MDVDTQLRNSLITTRTFVPMIGIESCGTIIEAMNNVLWSINEYGAPSQSVDVLKTVLSTTELSTNSSFIEPVIYNFAHSFLITIQKKWGEDPGEPPRQNGKKAPNGTSLQETLPSSSTTDGQLATAHVKEEPHDPDEPDTTRMFFDASHFGNFDFNGLEMSVDPESSSCNEGRSSQGEEEEMLPVMGKKKAGSSARNSKIPTKRRKKSDPKEDALAIPKACPFCSHKFNEPVTNKKIYTHIVKRHNSMPGSFFRCYSCCKNFTTSDHEKTCNGRFEFHYDPTPPKRTPRITGLGDNCPFCDKVLAATKGTGISVGAISDHIQRKHVDVPGTFFRCTKCPDILARQRTQLYYHLKTGCDGDVEYHYNPEGSFTGCRKSVATVAMDTCEFCDKMLANRAGEGVTLNHLSQHIMLKHASIPGTFFRCGACTDFKKRDRSAIYSHIQTQACGGTIEYFYDAKGHFAPSSKRIPILKDDNCPFCDEVLSSCEGGGVLISRLADHLSRKHQDVKGSFFRCSNCHDVQGRERVSIREHIKNSECEGRIEYFHDETYKVLVGKPRVSIIDGEVCPLCSVRLVEYDGEPITKKRLYEHLCKCHQDIQGTFFRCSECKDFKARDTYKIYTHYKDEDCGGTTEFHYSPVAQAGPIRTGFIAGDNCPQCNEQLTNYLGEGITQTRLVEHFSKKHHGLTGSFLRCSACHDTRSRDLPRLYMHIKEEECGGRIEYFYDDTPMGVNNSRGVRAISEDDCPFCHEVLALYEGDGVTLTRLIDHISRCHQSVVGTFLRCSVCTDIRKRDRAPLYMHIKHGDCGGKIEYFYDKKGHLKRPHKD